MTRLARRLAPTQRLSGPGVLQIWALPPSDPRKRSHAPPSTRPVGVRPATSVQGTLPNQTSHTPHRPGARLGGFFPGVSEGPFPL